MSNEDLRLRKIKINSAEKKLKTNKIHNSHYNEESQKIMSYVEIIQANKEKHEQHKLDLAISANIDYTTVKKWSLNEVMNFTKYNNKRIELQNAKVK